MRANIRRVIDAFLQGAAAVGDSRRTCRTDGRVLWSYDMPIADRTPSGNIRLISRLAAPTNTTLSQIRACMTRMPRAERVGTICENYRFQPRSERR